MYTNVACYKIKTLWELKKSSKQIHLKNIINEIKYTLLLFHGKTLSRTHFVVINVMYAMIINWRLKHFVCMVMHEKLIAHK
jgi:hypothetical protein